MILEGAAALLRAADALLKNERYISRDGRLLKIQ